MPRSASVGSLAKRGVIPQKQFYIKLFIYNTVILMLLPDNPPGGPPREAYLTSDPAGELWGCFAGHVIRRDNGSWRIAAHAGLPETLCRSLAFPGSGDVWAGFTDAFASFRPGAPGVRRYERGGEAGTATSYSFGVDRRGWLWRGSQDGMYVADEAQAKRGVWLHLSDADGLTDLDVNHGSFFSDADGSVWWAAATSILHFSPPPDLLNPSAAPSVFLAAFSVDGGPPKLAESVREVPGGKRLAAHLGSLQFERPNAVRIRYRVLPEQRDWREPAGPDVDLGKPWWGRHKLEVECRFSVGQWAAPLGSEFVILRPWWLSWPAMLLLVGMGCGGAAGGARWRRKRRVRAQTSLPNLDGWRMAVLSPESELIGATLDRRFEVLGLVARGGFATVFRGSDRSRRERRWCAIKIFRRELVDEQWLTHRFQQEVTALEQIRHSSVVSIYGHGMAPGGVPYLAMEFIDGGTLRDLLNAGPLDPQRAASLLQQAAAALEQIHARGIYHRDLKPENLMLRRGARPGQDLVLIDFSIAIVKEPDQTIHGLSRAAGTIYYMAPEQAVGFATAASDVYSLAKVVLEMLTGKRLSEMLPNASMDLPERVRELARRLAIRLSPESVELLGRALEFDPGRRPQSAMEFARPLVRDLKAASCGLSANPGPCPTDGGPAAR